MSPAVSEHSQNKKKVRFVLVETQLAQFTHLRGMLDVERQKSNTLQTEVLYRGAENL